MTRTQRYTMLVIAEGLIRARAEMDGYDTVEYDPQNDPEGYVTSIITALCHWTHSCGRNWAQELRQAQALYDMDIAENGPWGLHVPSE